jgi:hypothetical protein
MVAGLLHFQPRVVAELDGGVRISRLLEGSCDDKDNFRRFVGRWQSAQLSG